MAHARPISGSISGRIARSIRVEYGAPGGDIPDRAACWLVCGPEFRDGQIVRDPVEEDPDLLADMHAVRVVGDDVGHDPGAFRRSEEQKSELQSLMRN